MRDETAFQSVCNYIGSDVGQDLGPEQVENLTKNLVDTVKSDRLMTPEAVDKHARLLFPEICEKRSEDSMHKCVSRNTKISKEELDEKLREAMSESDDLWFRENADAFIQPIRERILTSGETVYFNAEGLKRFLDHAELPIRADIEHALRTGWANSNYKRFSAGDKFVLARFRQENHPDPTSAAAFCEVINHLGREQNWQLSQNGVQARYEDAAKKAQAAILKKGKYPVWSPVHGQIRWVDGSELDRMDPGQLAATVRAARDLYRKIGESREQQQERLQEFADAAGGVRRFRSGDTDSLTGEVQFKEGPGARFEFVGEHRAANPSSGPKMDRNTPVSAELPAHIADLFTDKTTGKFYAKTALHRLARVNPKIFRLMMNTNITFMNELLKQDN